MKPGRIRDALCWLGVPVMLVGAWLWAAHLDEQDQAKRAPRVEARR